jgi:hypothetical protein
MVRNMSAIVESVCEKPHTPLEILGTAAITAKATHLPGCNGRHFA